MLIEILGPGCFKCQKLEEVTKQAVKGLGIDAFINHIKDVNVITNYGVMVTPALVVDGMVKSSGTIPTKEEVKEILGKKDG
jgi:small redox-active disulfide protein 2